MQNLRCFVLTICSIAPIAVGEEWHYAYAQEAEPRYRTLPLDPAGDKRKRDKDDLINPEKFNLAGLEAYYKENLLPRLLQENAVAMNDARSELMNDIELIERRSRSNAKMLEEYNKMLVKLLSDVINTKDANGKLAHPSSRVVAAVVAGRLNRQAATSQAGGLPDPEGTRILLRIFSPTENDGMVAVALTHLPRHWTWAGMDASLMEQARKKFVSNAEVFLASQKPGARGEEEESYLRELLIENLRIIANGDSESAKAAKPILISLIKSSLQKYKSESEWLLETAVHAFGQIAKPETSAEELVDLETQTLKFLQASLRAWNRRCAQTTYSADGTGSKFSGSSKGGLGFGTDEGGSKFGGDAGGKQGGANAPKTKNPFDEQPKEVKIARRILQQRLEKIHYGLDGFGKSHTSDTTKGILAFAAEDRKNKLTNVIAAVETLQKAINDEKITQLGELVSSTRDAITNLQTACAAIVGSDGQFDLPVEPEDSEDAETEGESSEQSSDEVDK